MKSLEDVQQELINIEQNVQDISKSIKSLNYEVGAIKEAARKESGQNVFDFARIKELSQNIRITDHPLVRFGNAEGRQLYIEMLLNMVRLDADQEACLNRMIYLQWLADHSKAERSLEALFKESLLLTKASYAQFAKSLKDPLASVFIADALITAYISGAVAEEVKSYLEEFFAVAGFEKDKVKPIAILVKKLLSGENVKFPAVGEHGLMLFGEARVGSYVKLGRYPQNNGNTFEPIEWQVLENDGKTALVVSRYGLDCKQFDSSRNNWRDCDLRKWLNGEFLQTAFSAEEQGQIALSKIYTVNNPNFGTSGCGETEDKVFCLSIDEANKYFASDNARKCQPTSYAVSRNAGKSSDGYCLFWLRSPGLVAYSAAYVDDDGAVSCSGDGVYNDFFAVRPALRIIL